MAEAERAALQAQLDGKGPGDIDVAEVHDCFAIAEICCIEALGFCEKGQGGGAARSGMTALGGKLPAPELPADALFLLGGGPWGSAGTRDLPTLDKEIELTKLRLEEGTPVVGFGLGAQILAIAAGGGSEPADLVFESAIARRTRDDALNGFLPETFLSVTYMRDRPVLPESAEVLAEDEAGNRSGIGAVAPFLVSGMHVPPKRMQKAGSQYQTK